MKRVMLVTAMVLAFFLTASAAHALTTYMPGDIASWTMIKDNPVGNATFNAYWNGLFSFNLGKGMSGDPAGFAQIQIGRKFGLGGWMGLDLSGYDQYALFVDNSGGPFYLMANIFINTGWTDDPWNEPDHFYQNGWTWLKPGEQTKLILDLSGVANLNHVTAIGVAFGTNIHDNPPNLYYAPPNWCFTGSAAIPEPTTLLLLGSGLLGLGAFSRLRRKKK